jgi:hypothetical protein
MLQLVPSCYLPHASSSTCQVVYAISGNLFSYQKHSEKRKTNILSNFTEPSPDQPSIPILSLVHTVLKSLSSENLVEEAEKLICTTLDDLQSTGTL